MNKFKERLNETLKVAGISQRELARRIKMSQSIVNNYCTGKHKPTLDVLIAICKELGETSDYLLGLVDY